MSKRVKLQNLIPLIRDGKLDIQRISMIEIKTRDIDIKVYPDDVTVYCTLDGDFSANTLHKELVSLGLIKK